MEVGLDPLQTLNVVCLSLVYLLIDATTLFLA